MIDGKGVLNNRISEYIFTQLNSLGVPTHFVRRLNMREQLIREVEIIPLEVVVRNVAAGSLSTRLGIAEGTALPRSIIEFYYKNDELGDPMVSEEHITAFGWASPQDLDDVMALAIRVNDFLSGLFLGVGIRLVDFKLEFGRLWEGEMMRICPRRRDFARQLPPVGHQFGRQARQGPLPPRTSAECWKPIRKSLADWASSTTTIAPAPLARRWSSDVELGSRSAGRKATLQGWRGRKLRHFFWFYFRILDFLNIVLSDYEIKGRDFMLQRLIFLSFVSLLAGFTVAQAQSLDSPAWRKELHATGTIFFFCQADVVCGAGAIDSYHSQSPDMVLNFKSFQQQQSRNNLELERRVRVKSLGMMVRDLSTGIIRQYTATETRIEASGRVQIYINGFLAIGKEAFTLVASANTAKQAATNYRQLLDYVRSQMPRVRSI